MVSRKITSRAARASRGDRLRRRLTTVTQTPVGGEVRCLLGEQVVTRPDRHVGEPLGDVLVPQHVQQGQVGAVGPGPDPVAGVRPAERRVQQGQVARRAWSTVRPAATG